MYEKQKVIDVDFTVISSVSCDDCGIPKKKRYFYKRWFRKIQNYLKTKFYGFYILSLFMRGKIDEDTLEKTVIWMRNNYRKE